MGDGNLVLKSINKLLSENCNFEVPSYQRGYRWKTQQVEDLLGDIAEFAESKKERETDCYCLQPLVVKKKDDKWEVIDGQQRLTTIYIILSYLEHNKSFKLEDNKKLFQIEYATKEESNRSLKDVQNPNGKKSNIDGFHFKQAYDTVVKWLEKKPEEDKDKWLAELLNAQFIWYETKDENENPREIFKRLNSGKIALTNSELIRALFIIDAKKSSNSELGFMQQSKIGSEWDYIEQQLHDNDFWAFITLNNPRQKDYPNRIEYIFDLIRQKEQGIANPDDKYTTFRMYNDWVNAKKPVTDLWQEVKEYYYRFNEWYIDNDFYHVAGFCFLVGLVKVADLLKTANEKPQSALLQYLKEKINSMIKVDFYEGSELELTKQHFNDNSYANSPQQKALKLFNVWTHMSEKLRCPFKEYKENLWSLEHILAQNSLELDAKNWKKWADDVSKKYNLQTMLADWYDDGENKEIRESFDKKIQELQGTVEEKYLHTIMNLALLTRDANSLLSNNLFPDKRQAIIELGRKNREDIKNHFIPIATKYVFLKYYSKDVEQMKKWDTPDCKDYGKALESCFSYFNTEGEKI